MVKITEIKLNLNERFILMQLLPKESDFVTLELIRNTVSSLGLKEEEFKEFEVKKENNVYVWNLKKDNGKNFEFKETIFKIIIKVLKKLNEEKKLTQKHFTLYKKFVLNNGGD